MILAAEAGSALPGQRSTFSGTCFPPCSSEVVLQVNPFPLHKPCAEVPNILQNKKGDKGKALRASKNSDQDSGLWRWKQMKHSQLRYLPMETYPNT